MSHYKTIHTLEHEKSPTYRIGAFHGRIALILGYPRDDCTENVYEIIISAGKMEEISKYME